MSISFTGLLLIGVAITLILLMFVIFQKEPPETTDLLDRTLLFSSFIPLAIGLLYGGVLILGGTLAGVVHEPELTFSIVFTNTMYGIFIVAGWIKIIRNQWNRRKRG